MRVLILHDAIPENARADMLDALTQARVVSDALVQLGHQPSTAPFDWNLSDMERMLVREAPDVVFNLVESVHGLGRLIYLAPALLDALGIAYTGAPTEAMFITSNKLLTKRMLSDRGIRTPEWLDPRNSNHDAQSRDRRGAGSTGSIRFAPGRYIIKSLWEEASVGLDEDSVIFAEEPAKLLAELNKRLPSLGGEGFAERYIDGREFNIALLCGGENPDVLPIAEIDFVGYGPEKPKVVGYRAKWDDTSYEYHHTPPRFDFPASDGPLLTQLRELAGRCWQELTLRGWVRVDFRVDAEGTPWVLEINANPCLSPDAGYAAALARAGISFPQVVDRILRDAVCEGLPSVAPLRAASSALT